MKYIKAYNGNENEWQVGIRNFCSYFEKIQNRFPKKFYSFYLQNHMHDCILKEMKFCKQHLSQRTRIDILTSSVQNEKEFTMLFKDVRAYRTDMDFTNGYCEFEDFIIGEFLAVDDDYLSFEFQFFNDSTVYIEFKKLIFR